MQNAETADHRKAEKLLHAALSRRQLNRTAVGDHAALATRQSTSLRSNKVDCFWFCQKRIGAAALPIRETPGFEGGTDQLLEERVAFALNRIEQNYAPT
jgi:hypothetical protein